MRLPIFAALTIALATTAVAQEQKYLLPGDKAPELKVAKYYQGTEIKKFETGKVYVVEFWATWCGPCIETIPHLNDLSVKQKGKAEFIGVNIWDEEEGQDERIKAFVEKMKDKMTYPVAVDTTEMHMTSKWMEASLSDGIPTAFIVNQEGKIAWVGHPMDIEKPLQEVIDKKFDIKAARDTREVEVKKAIEMNKLYAKVNEAKELYAQGKKEESLKILDELAKSETDISGDAKITKITLLATDNIPAAKEAIEKLASGEFSDQANLAFFTIEQATGEKGNKELAVFTADQLVAKAKKDDPIILYYIAPAYSVTKDHKKALAVLERALKAFDGSEYAKEEQMKEFRKEIEEAIAKEKAQIGN